MSEVRFGTAGWSFPDWYGPFYPVREKDEGPGALFTGVLDEPPDPDVRLARQKPLAYYARFFDAVEVNSSFYRIPSVKTTRGWADLTEEREGRPFLFSLKLPAAFSHEGLLDPADVRAFRECLAPIAERGRLAAVLAQFPQHFSYTPPATERLERIVETFRDLPLVVEVRHRTWEADAAIERVRALQVSLASIDQPQDPRSTLRPTEVVTDPGLGYVRLHGRNAAAWFDRKAGRDDKYDYLYGPDELEEWAGRIERLSGRTKRTIVIANNHFRGQAPANALELRARRGESPQVPRPLLRSYARLGELGR